MAKSNNSSVADKADVYFHPLNEPDEYRKKLRRQIKSGKKSWGRWKYDDKRGVPSIDLYKDAQTPPYEIELTRIETYAALSDWLLHLVAKTWVTPDDIGNLVVSVRDLDACGLHTLNYK